MSEKWAVVEQAGFTDERVASTWSTYDDACCALHEQYMPSEIEELPVYIMKWDAEQSYWTMEY